MDWSSLFNQGSRRNQGRTKDPGQGYCSAQKVMFSGRKKNTNEFTWRQRTFVFLGTGLGTEGEYRPELEELQVVLSDRWSHRTDPQLLSTTGYEPFIFLLTYLFQGFGNTPRMSLRQKSSESSGNPSANPLSSNCRDRELRPVFRPVLTS